MNADILKILASNNVKATPMRMLVLEQMIDAHASLSLAELELRLYPSDRITIYRTLQTFVKSGIAHTVESAGNCAFYALCKGECDHGSHSDEHPHFICEQCKKISCCTEFSYTLNSPSLTSGYEIHKTEMTLRGICPSCKKPE